jgi:hypothetical protein
MIQSRLKKSALGWSGLFISLVVLMLLLGQSIIVEGGKLLFSERITTTSSLKSTSQVYQLSIPISSEYTGIDFVYEENGKEVRFLGYLNELSDGYYLAFSQQEIKEETFLILSPVTFSQDNMNLFKQSVILQLAEDTGLSEEEVAKLIHPTVFYDHTQRIVNDFPIVSVWLILVLLLLWQSIRTTVRYLKLTSNSEIKRSTLWGKDSGQRLRRKERYILSTGVLQCGMNPVYVSYKDILLYEKDTQGIKLITKTLVFKIQGSEQLYEEIVKKVVPDFVFKSK